jgi:hypothetical protein
VKLPKREISIFNLSALDLFACALGAFMVLAVVALPYFGNWAQLDDETLIEKLKEKDAELKEEKARRKQAEDRAEELSKALAEAQFPALDLVVAIDVTGSMSDPIDGLKNELVTVAGLLGKLFPSVRVGVVAFGDREWSRPIAVSTFFDVKTSAGLSALREFVNGLSANGGCGDPCNNPGPPEAVYAALRTARDQPWRSDSARKVIMVITDNPAYPEEVQSSYQLAEQFKASGGGRSVGAAFIVTENTGPTAKDFLKQLAAKGGGRFVPYGGSMTAAILESVVL